MDKKQIARCRWTTKNGTQCKNRAIGNSELCYRHNVTVRFRTQIIIGCVLLIVGSVITILQPDIIKRLKPEKTLLERVKIEGKRATKIEDKTQVPVYAHSLYELGILALKNRDFAAYTETIHQMLRVHTLSWTNPWLPGPDGRLARDELYDQLIKLITTEQLRLSHRIEISEMLGNVAMAGTENSIKEYNLGNFFSDNLFIETLEIMRRAINTLWLKGDTQFAHSIFEVMRDVTLAEAHRRLDQGYRICPIETDRPQLTISAQRIADLGQPRDLDSYYRACNIIAKIPQPLINEFLNSKYYYGISYLIGTDSSAKELRCTPDDVRKWRYYSGEGTFLLAVRTTADSLVIDSLISSNNRQRQIAADCVRQLVKRERYR